MFSHKLDEHSELRLVEPLHARAMFELIDRNRARFSPWMTFTEHVTSVESQEERARTALGEFADAAGIHCGIWYDGMLAGGVGASVDRTHGSAEAGYWLGAEFEGKGLVTQAARKLIDYLFEAMNVNRVIIRTAVGNERSRAVAERLGFVTEGIHRQSLRVQGKFQDVMVHAMLAEDWKSAPLPAAMFAGKLGDIGELSLLEHRHAATLFDLIDRNREHIGDWLPWVDDTRSVGDIATFIRVQLSNFAAKGNIPAGIRHDGRLAGVISLIRIEQTHRHAEIGYWVGKEFEGKGLVTQATRAILDHAFGPLGLNRVIIKAEPANRRSRAVPERLGFTHEGRLRQVARSRDRFVDHELYSMLREEWDGRP